MGDIKKNFINLTKAWSNDKDVLSMIEKDMNYVGNYVNKAYMMEYTQTVYEAQFEGQELQDKLVSLHQNCQEAHEAAVAGVSQLTRLAGMKGLEPMYKGPDKDFYEVSNFCEETVHEFFPDRAKVQSLSLNEYEEKAESDMIMTNEGFMHREDFEQRVLSGSADGLIKNEPSNEKKEELER